MSGVETPPRNTQMPNSRPAESCKAVVAAESSRGKETELNVQDGQRIALDINASQDYLGGMTKIVPSDDDVSSFLQCKLSKSIPLITHDSLWYHSMFETPLVMELTVKSHLGSGSLIYCYYVTELQFLFQQGHSIILR